MFIEALILSITIGYILNGSIKNLNTNRIKSLYLVFLGFSIELMTFIPVRKGLISIGIVTYIAYLIEYMLIFLFIYLNRWNKCILLMGIGFILNGLVIFINKGAMPVSLNAINMAGLSSNASSEGLYTLVNESTKLWFLGDVISFKIIKAYVVSIGDIIAAIGLMLFVIIGMLPEKKA